MYQTPSPDWLYVYTERIAILCGKDAPTDEQKKIASEEADFYVANAYIDNLKFNQPDLKL